jgi:hypothetical protein
VSAVATPRSSVIRALARVDGRKLLLHPIFLAGVAMAVLGSAMFVAFIFERPWATWEEEGWTAGVGAMLLGVLTMVATNRAALRDRREDTVEQHGVLPVDASTRIGGLLGATAWPAVATAALLALVVGIAAWRGVNVDGSQAVHLVERVWSIVMLGAMGIALAVWLPRSFVAAFAAWGLLFIAPGEVPRAWHSVAPFTGLHTVGLAMWHLVYVVGLTGVFAVAALARFDRRRGVLVAGAVALAIVATSVAVMLGQACPTPDTCTL